MAMTSGTSTFDVQRRGVRVATSRTSAGGTTSTGGAGVDAKLVRGKAEGWARNLRFVNG